MDSTKKYDHQEAWQPIVSDKQEQYGNRGYVEIMNWIEEFQEFTSGFQTLEDVKNSIKNKGQKYGDYTEQAIEATYKIRKGKKP
ncbi:MAG: hypothetical protein SH856_02395 [Flavobacteriales bacterium]|nr:hypothetical protein [Flavobacteriales bacterium]